MPELIALKKEFGVASLQMVFQVLIQSYKKRNVPDRFKVLGDLTNESKINLKEGDEGVIKKLDILLEQNKVISKGIMLVEDKLTKISS